MKFNLAIGGNISSGKTTAIENFRRLPGASFAVAPEPAEENPFLAKSYSDPDGYKCLAQMWFLSSRLLTYRNLPPSGTVFDRHLLEDPLFAKLNYSHFTDEQKRLYELHHAAVMFEVEAPDVYIRMQTSPEVCFSRLLERNNEYEVGFVTLDYLNRLHDLYEDFWQETEKKTLVVHVNGDGDVDYARLWKFVCELEKGKTGTVYFQ